ncbi:MAG: TraM recognition domain-containing protein [Ignavibacteriales bacterium]|nr:TraM recognition domain-containing protein [Oligoflexia bacterium]MCZ2142008.1 TraM recognition domain-containing protein [Ignavibacteriales bacterium]
MADKKSAGQSQNDEMWVAGGIGVVGLVCLIAVAKYAPPLICGAVIGWFLYASKYSATFYAKVRAYVFTLSFFSGLCFLLIGLPELGVDGDFYGILPNVPGFGKWCWSVAGWWNHNAPGLSFLKGLRVKSLTYEDVSLYMWLSVFSAVVFSLIYFGVHFFKNRNLTEESIEGEDLKLPLLKIASYPARAVSIALYCITTGWARFGASAGLDHRGSGVISNLVLMLVFTGALAVSYFISTFTPSIPFLNLRRPAEVLIFLPAVCMWVGFLFSKILPESSLKLLGFQAGDTSSRKRMDFELGRTFRGRPFRLTEKNLSYHVEMIAPTGSGKTNTLKNLIAHRISQGHGVIFLDFKAEFDVVSWMYRAAIASKREKEFRLISLSNRELSVPYNPVRSGSASEIHSQIMNSMTWSEEYYRKVSSVALLTLLRGLTEYRDVTGESFHIRHIYELLETKGMLRSFALRLASKSCPAAEDVSLMAEKLDRPSEREKLMGLIANLHMLVHSAAGDLIGSDVTHGAYDFKEAIDESRITYVLMNSLKLKESASVFGKMILQDLMAFVGERYSTLQSSVVHRPVTLIIDEFASFAIPEFIEFMDRARGAGIGIVIAHQARADLRQISPEFQERIEANSNTTLVSGLKSSQDAEYFAGMLGTKTVTKETVQIEEGFFGEKSTGMKSVREVEEYVIHPNRLKDLSQGELFAISRTVDSRWGLVRVARAPEFKDFEISSEELTKALMDIRGQYLTGSDLYLDLKAEAPGLTTRRANQEESTENLKVDIWS